MAQVLSVNNDMPETGNKVIVVVWHAFHSTFTHHTRGGWDGLHIHHDTDCNEYMNHAIQKVL